jgi:Tfp pilus assembly protein PilF
LKDEAQAASAFELCAKYSLEDEFKPDVLSTALNNLGTIYMKKEGTLKQAMHYLGESIKVDPERYSAHANMGEVLSRLGDRPGAIRHYKAATEIKENADVHNNWGIAIYQQHVQRSDEAAKSAKATQSKKTTKTTKKKAKADSSVEARVLDDVLWHYRQAMHLDPNHGNAHHNAGKVLYHRRDFDGAAEAFGRCTKLVPEKGLYAYDFALALLRRGRIEDRPLAAEHLHRAIASKDPTVDVMRARHNLLVAEQPQ